MTQPLSIGHPLVKARQADPEYRITCALKVSLLLGEASLDKEVLKLGHQLNPEARDRINKSLQLWEELKAHLKASHDIADTRLKESSF